MGLEVFDALAPPLSFKELRPTTDNNLVTWLVGRALYIYIYLFIYLLIFKKNGMGHISSPPQEVEPGGRVLWVALHLMFLFQVATKRDFQARAAACGMLFLLPSLIH